MNLESFLNRKEILIDDSGWGDLILGVVVGAIKLPDRRYMERRISTSSFQPPHFENKRYLRDASNIAQKIVEAMKPDKETLFKVCSGYVLSSVRRFLKNMGFHVQVVEVTGELQEKVENGFIKWCIEIGIPKEEARRRSFSFFLEWVGDKPHLREKLVKTGWKSWQKKWREKAFDTRFR